MKMKKLVNIGIKSLLIILLVTGCTKKFDKEKFKSKMKDNKFEVTDISKTESIAVGKHFIITFSEFKNQKEAEDYVKKEIKDKDYKKDNNTYTLKNNYIYSIYQVKDKYVISSFTPLKYKSEVEDTFEKITK